MTEETWSDLPYDLSLSRYEVSTYGKLRNKNTNYIFNSTPTLAGYIPVDIKNNNGKSIGIGLHILVARHLSLIQIINLL